MFRATIRRNQQMIMITKPVVVACSLCVVLPLPGQAQVAEHESTRATSTGSSPEPPMSLTTRESAASDAMPGEKPMPSLIQKLPDYAGDIWQRSCVTGDWGGARTELAEHGILFEADITQNLQGNARGGKNTSNALEYGGAADYWLKFDTARMGLWPGGLIVLHGETQFGRSVNANTGSLMSPNFKSLLPVPDDPGITTLSEWYMMQALSEQIVLVAGKIDPTALADRNAFAGDARHTTQFMNTAFNINPVVFNGAPYTTLGAGVILIPTEWLEIASILLQNNPDSTATTSGLDTAFSQGNQMAVGQEYMFTIKPFDRIGHQRLGWLYTNRNFGVFDADSRVSLPIRSITIPGKVKSRPDNYCFYYNFDQYLFSEAADPTQGWGIFGRFGVAPQTGNVFQEFYSFGFGGKGTIPTRDRDTWGAGYYYASLDSPLGSALGISREQGIEIFYSIEVTPWFHVTPDFQVIVDPADGYGGRDTALVYGIRGQINL